MLFFDVQNGFNISEAHFSLFPTRATIIPKRRAHEALTILTFINMKLGEKIQYFIQ